jgi:protein-tyrosine phosphatase
MQFVSKKMLFICTGNQCRSRYAEAVFNHLAASLDLSWRAFSRGLDINTVQGSDLSRFTADEMDRVGLDRSLTGPTRIALTAADLDEALHPIALKEQEHRPMMQAQFLQWVDRIEYWNVHDLDCAPFHVSLPLIYDKVKTLAVDLAAFERVGVS